jgi:CBS domain containing-hemolysin-like protein
MPGLVIAIAITLGMSFVASLLEAIVLSTSVAEIEALKKTHPRRGRLLETIKQEINETISAILTLNTISNAFGSVIIGAICGRLFGERVLVLVTMGFAALLLVGSEMLPKIIGVAHRRQFLPFAVLPLLWLRRALRPITWLSNLALWPFMGTRGSQGDSEEEIILLAERGARLGTLTKSESSIIANALSLDDVRVTAIMTPRTVIAALRRSATVGEVFLEFPNLPFGRMPVYGKNLDDIVGIVRRRDLLKAKANDQDLMLVEQVMTEANFIPKTATVADALQCFLKAHQQMIIAVDEFGATAGVLTMEDVIEHLLGREIFEKDDVAVDMRELARARSREGMRPPSERQG